MRWRDAHLDFPGPHQAEVMVEAQHIPVAGHNHHNLERHVRRSVTTGKLSSCANSPLTFRLQQQQMKQ